MTLPEEPGRTGVEYRALVPRLLHAADRGAPLPAFLEEVTRILLEISRGGSIAVRLEEWTPGTRAYALLDAASGFRFETERVEAAPDSGLAEESHRDALYRALTRGAGGPTTTRRGGLWIADAADAPPVRLSGSAIEIAGWARAEGFRSFLWCPLHVEGRVSGWFQIVHERAGIFDAEDVEHVEDVAEAIGLALTHHRAQWALQERVKELTCLYGIAKVAGAHARPLPDLLTEIVRLLPPGWQYPDRCAASIRLDGVAYATPDYRETDRRQAAEIVIDGRARGTVEVVYLAPRPQMHEGPFLIEERNLINEVARQIALIVEGREAEHQRERLKEQLYHSDRLATLGMLTAGAAHELNEPLGSILGFAQLARETSGLPGQVAEDLDKIVRAALHVREIIKKLMYFGRQTPPRTMPVDLNETIREGLSLIASRIASQRISVIERLDPRSPQAVADPGQILQVFVNLAVNAVQAMPEGGELTVSTRTGDDSVFLAVEDTGAGMPEEVLKQIFVPFFTTKDVGQGTGLGLSVAHGIVSAHGGAISVTSEPGMGSRFEVRLPAAGANNERT